MSEPTEANRMRWQFQPGHYEVWYVTLSHRASQTGFWIRYTLEAPETGHGEPYAQLWFARFDGRDPSRTFGFNRRMPIGELRHEADPFRLRLGEAVLTQGSCKGALASTESEAAHAVEWDLTWRAAERVHLHLPKLAYVGSLADTQVLSPNLDVRASGTIVVDGERYTLADAPLGQTHLWGRKHAYSWAWSHVNAFDQGKGVLETLTVRLRRGPIVLPRLTLLSLEVDGEHIDIREPWQMPLARSDYGTGHYQLHALSPEFKVDVALSCRAEDMIVAEYVDPDGDAAYCHNTECGDARISVLRRTTFGRFRPWRELIATKTAHFEWGARAGDYRVKKRHVRID